MRSRRDRADAAYSPKARGSSHSGGFTRTSDTIYTALKSELYLRLSPGARLTEGTLSERFGVSRIPVREALQRLVREGFLEAHFRNGYSVAIASRQQTNDLNQVRALFEREAVSCIANSPEAFPELDNLWSVWNGGVDRDSLSPTELSSLNREFHLQIVSCSRNSEMARLHEGVFDRIEVLQRVDFTSRERVETTFREHVGILESLRAKDRQGSIERLHAHLQGSNLYVRSMIQMMEDAAKIRHID